MDILIFIVLGALGVILLVAGIAGAMMLKRQKEKGMVARALNMTLFSVRLPRESPKEGQQNKQGKELLAVMEQLYSSFNNFRSTGWNSMLYGGPYLSFEIAVHNIGEEIHFYVSAPKRYANTVEKQILGLYPSAEVNMVKDYNIFNPHGGTAASYMRLLRNPLLPIRTYSKLEADPLGEVLTAMSKLKEKGEGAALQVLLRPSQNAKMKKLAMKVSKEIKMGKGFGDALKKAGEHEVAKIGREMFLEITGLKVQQTPGQPLTPAQTAQQTATPYHEELVKAVSEKFSKPAFDVDIRLVASGADDARASEILHEVESAFVQFGSPDLNAFSASRISGPRLKKLIFDFSFRMFNDAESMYLSTEEVASVYHFPTVLTAAPRVKFLKAKSAEPPSDLPSEGIILVKNS